MMVLDLLKNVPVVISGAFSSFRKNNDLTAASSLAFSATLALIPVLFLLTFLLGAVIGSSSDALTRTQELLNQLIPAYSQDILSEVRSISAHMGAIGFLNGLVLLLSITPLVADMRISLATIFQRRLTQPFLMEKLFDVAISIVFLMGLSVIAIAGIVFTLVEKKSQHHLSLGYLEGAAPFLFVMAVIFSIYLMFSARARLLHLLIGALAASSLWFAMRPVFQLFLVYNPGYGFAFGSFKSLFIVIIWIYCSLVAFLVGAEIAASLGRDETVFLKKLMEGRKNVPLRIIGKYVKYYAKGSVIFREGELGTEMYSVLKGSVTIVKGGKDLAVIPEGKYFGEMSYLLSAPRVATAKAQDDVELVTISSENINKLMNEYPEFVLEMLREMAERLRATNEFID
jgi:YihY family inner membrane protein